MGKGKNKGRVSSKSKGKNEKSSAISFLALCMIIGLFLGAIYNQVIIGVCLGTLVGVIIDARNKKK